MRSTALAASFIAAAILGVGATAAMAQTYGVGGDGTRSFVWDNGDSFSGAFRNGRPNGPGVFRAANGQVHKGEWRDGCLVSDQGHRVAVFTRLSDCPRAPRPRQPPLPRADFFR